MAILNFGWSHQIFLLIGLLCVLAESADDNSKVVTCLEGWTQLHRGCYKFVAEETTWAEAFDKCKLESSELVEIRSTSEKEALQNHLVAAHPEIPSWWVGLKREGSSATNWKWIDGEPVQTAVTPWINSKISARPGEVSGVVEIKSGSLHLSAAARTNPKAYICEFHSITPRPETKTTIDIAIQDEATTPVIDKGRPSTEVFGPSEPINTDGGYSSSSASDGAVKRKTAITSASGRLNLDTTSPTSASTTTASSTTHLLTTTSRHSAESSGATNGSASTGTGWTRTPSPTSSTTTTTTTPSTTTTTTTTTPTTTTTTSTTTTTRRSTTSTRAPPTPTPPAPPRTTVTPPPAPRPSTTPNDWEEAYKTYEGCYVPVHGGNLMQIVVEAKKLYRRSSRTCPEINVGGLKWPETPKGPAAVKCLSGEGNATWSCGGQDIVCWIGSPDINSCASKKLQKLLKLVEAEKPSTNSTQTAAPPTAEETIHVTSQLLEVTRSENTTMDDVMVTSNVISRLTERLDNVNDTKQISTIMDNILKVGSNLVSEDKAEVWENMAPEDKVRSASTLMVAMETATLSMVEEIKEPSVIVKKEEHIDLKMAVLDVTKMEKQELTYESDSDFTSVSIPKETLVNFSEGSLTKAVFITHYSMSSFLGGSSRKKPKQPAVGSIPELGEAETRDKADPAEEDDGGDDATAADEESGNGVKEVESKPRIASYILSASLGTSGHIRKLPKPITFTMKLTQLMKHDQIALCSFWNITNGDSLGFWAQDGCQVVTSQSNTTHTTCQCDHMTNFAILLDVHGLKLDHVHQSILNLVTIIGCVISSTALLASWVTFQCFNSLQGERNSIHKNLVVCLLVAEIIFVAGIDQYERKVLCSVIAGFLHFFFLSAFTWMFLEGLHIIFMLVQVFDSNRSRLPYYYFAGYGVPLIVISASCLFYYEGYGTENYCWLKHERYFIWAFAGPVALILLVNALFLAYAMSTVCRHSEYVFSSKDKTTGSGIRAWIQGALALEILLGLTWTLGYFFISDASVPMAYIFSIANSLQGLFIFVFHCLLNKKAQKEYRSVVHSVVSRSSSSVGTHSTLTKRSNQHSHELNHGYHQRLTNTHSHSTA